MAGSEKNPPNPLLLNDHCSVQGREDKVFAQGRQTRRAPKKNISASECRIQESACFQICELKKFVVSILRKSLIINGRVFESAKVGLGVFLSKVYMTRVYKGGASGKFGAGDRVRTGDVQLGKLTF